MFDHVRCRYPLPESESQDLEYQSKSTPELAMEFLRESREDIAAGRTQPAVEALERFAKKHFRIINSPPGKERKSYDPRRPH